LNRLKKTVSNKKYTRPSVRQTTEEPRETVSAEQLRTEAGGIAHDLNTVITTIYGFSEIALESIDGSSDAAQNVQKIIQAADKAKSLTKQLLNLSLEKEQEMIIVRVEEVINDTLNLLLPSLAGNVTVSCLIKAPDIEVEAVPEKLFRVFMNIAVNALQSMEGKGGRLTVTLDREVIKKSKKKEEREEFALIRFEDTGRGMNGETAEKMFMPFFTRGKGDKGTGLGLAVVYDIVREHGGTLRVSSEKGRGTAMEVLIPALSLGPLP